MSNSVANIRHISKLLGFKLPQHVLQTYINLSASLTGLADNRTKWFSLAPTHKIVLKQHLAFTLLAPGGKASRARTAVDLLTQIGYLANPGQFTPDYNAEFIKPHVRFHNVKGARLHDLLLHWDHLSGIVVEELSTKDKTVSELRARLADNMPGFGKKATAHFMRNTGICSGIDALPIIDVHIHKALAAFGFKHATYEEAEEGFIGMAKLMDLDVHLLDAWLWCGYANNWDFGNADFDNFTTNKETKT
jgi:thermostable 8-oxoguanine DNA glycosylase